MRVDRGGSKGLPGAPEKSEGGTTLQKKGNKLTLNTGDQDTVHISQAKNSLKIQINQEQVLTLTPEESKNFRVTGNLKNVSISPEVTLPLSELPQKPNQDVPAKESGGRKDERALTGQVTREILIGELKNFLAEQGEPTVAKKMPQESASMEDIEVNLNTLRGPDIVSITQDSSLKSQETISKHEPMPLASGMKEETSLTATIKKKDLSSTLGEAIPDALRGERPENLHGEPILDTGMPSEMRKEAKVFIEPDLQSIGLGDQKSALLRAEMPQLPLAKSELSHFLDGNPLSLDDKSKVLEGLSGEAGFSIFEERGINALVASVADDGELRDVLPDLAGFRVAHALKDPEMKICWDRLISAMNRPELALDPLEAAATAGILAAEPKTLERLMPGCVAHLLSPEESLAPQGELNLLDRRSLSCLLIENTVREQTNQPLVQAADLRQSALEMITDGSLSNEEKSAKLEVLKLESGLSDFQMREIVTRPVANFLQNAIGDTMQERDSIIQTMESKIQEAADSFGSESVAVEIVKAEHDEALAGIDSRAQRLQNLQTVVEGVFLGSQDPLVKADRMFEGMMTGFFPALHTIQPEVNKILQGAVTFQSGKLETALAQVARSGFPELKSFVQPASIFIHNVRNGAFPALLVQLSSHPAVPRDSTFIPEFLQSAKFLAQLTTGTFARQIESAMDSMIERTIPSQFQEQLSRIQNWRSEIANSSGYETKARLMNEAEALQQQFIPNLQSSLPALARGVSDLFEDPRFQSAMDMTKTGSNVVTAFRNGHFAQMLTALNQRLAGNAAVKQIIEQALHITNCGTPFFRGLFNREWERPIFTALKKSSGNKELQEVVGIFNDTLNLFLPLTSVENSSPFLQYQKQLAYLKDEELMNDWLHQYQSRI